MKDFVHLHLHTECSLLDGAVRVSELVKHVGQNELEYVAVTDHGTMMGIAPLLEAIDKWHEELDKQIKELKGEGGAASKEKIEALERQRVKPIAGVEAYLSFEDDTKNAQHYHLVLLAENYEGYKNLCYLVSESYKQERFYRHPVITYNSLKAHAKGLICSTACLAGPLSLPIKDWTLVTPLQAAEDDEKNGGGKSSKGGGSKQQRRVPITGNLTTSRANLAKLRAIFPEGHLYIELMLHPYSGLSNTNNAYHPQSYVLAGLLLLAKESGLPVLVTNDVHFLRKEDARIQQMMVCIGVGTKYDNPGKLVYSHEEYFKTREELRFVFERSYTDIAEKYIRIQQETGVSNPDLLAEDEYLSFIDQGLDNSLAIARRVEAYKLKQVPLMPDFEIPPIYQMAPTPAETLGEESDYEKFVRAKAEAAEAAKAAKNGKKPPEPKTREEIKEEARGRRIMTETFAYLKDLTYEGAQRRWGLEDKSLPPEIYERLEYELSTILRMGFPGYFLIVLDFINYARSHNYGIGPGRGSAAGSAVSYCLKITNLDPLKYGLLFERFLNPDRVSLPDIDVDLDDRSRQLVIEYLREKYGSDHVGGIVTLGSSMIKNAINDVARVLETPEPIPAQVRAALKRDEEEVKANKIKDVKKKKLKEYYQYCHNLRALRDSSDPEMAAFMRDLEAMEGRMRNVGQHACGYVICKYPIYEIAPTMRLQSGKTDGAIIQYEGGGLEGFGLVKMDLLGLRTIQILARTADEIEKSTGKRIDIDSLPLDDPDTLALLGRGETVEVFQFESPGMRGNLRRLKPSGIEDLIAMNALFRPGPIENIPEYIERKHGRREVKCPLDCMEEILKPTYGITVYQEQVMALSRIIAGFSRGDSDQLRKAIGKKKLDLMAKMKTQFIEGGKRNHHDEEKLKAIWEEWVKFADYAFNRSHAACYAYIAMHAAYLKAHYPKEYMVACLQSETTSKRLEVVVQECRRMGIKLLLPDINLSGEDFQIERGDIRFGLTRIKGINSKQVEEIIAERELHGPFTSLEDLLTRLTEKQLPQGLLHAFAESGALDSLAPGGQRIALLNVAEERIVVKTKRGAKEETEEAQKILGIDLWFEYGKSLRIARSTSTFGYLMPPPPVLRTTPPTELERMEMLNTERELLKVYISGHPLDSYKLEIMSCATLSINALESQQAEYRGKMVYVAGMVSISLPKEEEKKEKKSLGYQRGNYVEFTLEDYTGELRLFVPQEQAKKEYKALLKPWERVWISLQVEYSEKSKRYRYNVLNIESLESIRQRGIAQFNIEVNANSSPTTLQELMSLIDLNSNGTTPLVVDIFDPKTQVYLHYPAPQRRLRVDLAFTEALLEREIPFKINTHPVQQNLFSVVDKKSEEGEEEEMIPSDLDPND